MPRITETRPTISEIIHAERQTDTTSRMCVHFMYSYKERKTVSVQYLSAEEIHFIHSENLILRS